MRIAKGIWLFSLMFGFSSSAHAFYCSSSKGNGFVNIGDTPQTAQKACGVPDNVVKQTIGGTKVQQVQYWTYTPQPVEARVSAPPPAGQTNYPPNVTFVVINNKVTAINVLNKQVTTSNLCRTGMLVRVGQEAQSVMTSCGRPDFIDTEQQNVTEPKQQMVIWTYNTPSGAPIILTFINGQLSKTSP